MSVNKTIAAVGVDFKSVRIGDSVALNCGYSFNMMCGSVSLSRLAPKVGALGAAKHHRGESVIITLKEH